MIRLEGVSKFYKTEAGVSVGLTKANLSLSVGEFVAIVGESGSGKTTLLNVISGLDSYEEGEMYLFSKPTSHYEIEDLEKYRSTYIGFIFQNYNIIDSYTVYENIMLALDLQGYPQDKMKERALELIDKVGLTHRKNAKAAKLSGGEKQRAVIARALAKDCPVIVADEPTGNLDSASGAKVMELLASISKEKLVVVVSHNYSEVEPYATRKIRLHDGLIVEDITLKNVDDTAIVVEPDAKKVEFSKILKWSIIDLFSKPKRFIFLLSMQLIVMLLFSLSYLGVQQTAANQLEFDYFYNQSSRFTKSRINIAKFDNTSFTNEEINIFKNNKEVINVNENSLVFLDQVSNLIISNHDERSNRKAIVGVGESSLFDRSIGGEQSLLWRGRLPESSDEIILSRNYYNDFGLDEELRLQVLIRRSSYQDLEESLTVVGYAEDSDNSIYFHPDFGKINEAGRKIYVESVISTLQAKFGDATFNVETYFDPTLDINTIKLRPIGDNFSDNIIIYNDYETYLELSTPELKFDTVTLDFPYSAIGISYQLAEEIVRNFDLRPYEISLTVKDQIEGNNLINRLDNNLYQIKTFYIEENVGIDLVRQIFAIIGAISLFFNILFLYAILGLVIRNSMQARKKDFAIFRSIGANQKVIGSLVILQQLIVSILAFIGLLIIVSLLYFFLPTKYFDFRLIRWYHLVILFAAFMSFSTWLGSRFNRKIFKITVIRNLSLEEEI